MKITCDIIRDLLPLYAEDMVSQDSKQLVDEHLCQCDPCTRVLAALKKNVPLPVETDPEPLNKVRKMILRRRVLSVFAALLTLATVFSFVITWLFVPFQLTMEQAIDDFYIREDGAVVIDYSSAVVGRMRTGNDSNWYMIEYSTRYDMWKGERRKSIEELFGMDGKITEEEHQRYENIDIVKDRWISYKGKPLSNAPIPEFEDSVALDNEKNWWYSDPAGLGNDILLYDAGKEIPAKEDRYQFSPVYPMFFFGGLLGSALLLMMRKFAKKQWVRELLFRLTAASGSIAFATLFVSNGRIFTSTVGLIDQYWGCMIGVDTVLLMLSVLLWRQLYLLNQQDKGRERS